MDANEKFIKDVEYQIEHHSTRLGISSEMEQRAKDIYGMYVEDRNTYTRPDEVFAVASIYLAHRLMKEPTTTGEMIDGTDIEERQIIRVYNNMQKKLASDHNIEIPIFTAEEFIDKIGRELQLSDEVIEDAKEINENTEEVMLNKANSTRAAASVYLACQQHALYVTQEEIAKVAGVTMVTIRNRYKEQKEHLGISA